MNVIETELPGVLILEPTVHRDERGFFIETYRADKFHAATGCDSRFLQDGHSRSNRGVLRGMHAQKNRPQGKLVRVAKNKVFDVVANINPGSAQFGHWLGYILSDENNRQLWIPPGYVHGFVVLSAVADLEYKCSAYYDPYDEIGVVWNDPDLGIKWPIEDPVVSEKDRALPRLSTLGARSK